MTVWLLIVFAVASGQIQGAALVSPFFSEEACIASRQFMGSAGHNVRHTRCAQVSLGEDA
jgi:hypothetical protein